MNDKEAAAAIRRWLDSRRLTAFSWPTDACGYDQHMKFVEHRNRNWQGGDEEAWRQFVLAYADSLDGGKGGA